jgi:diguanylate cyclase (GGDEF)-like protein
MGTIEKLINSRINEFSILMFDIDNFKGINDTYGHIAGDMCIKRLALIAKSSIRDEDSIGRYGGDEFVVVLPSLTISQARLVAERFRKKVDETESPHFSVSIGIASYPQDASNVKELIAAADEGLYKSKRKGRNTVSHRDLF